MFTIKYREFTIQQRIDDILDKISKYGIDSINKDEKELLDLYSTDSEEEINKKLISEVNKIFEDNNGYFKFEYKRTVNLGDEEIQYIGTLYVPDLKLANGKLIKGKLEGKIVVYKNGQVSPDFFNNSKQSYDVFEFCNGLEYELDSFLDYIVCELGD
jgi:hypothetical protein